jgi:hypothetical protein
MDKKKLIGIAIVVAVAVAAVFGVDLKGPLKPIVCDPVVESVDG